VTSVETIVAAAISALAALGSAWIATRAAQSPPRPVDSPVDSPPPHPGPGGLRRLAAAIRERLHALPPLRRRTRPWLAALLGFLFGGFGPLLYLRGGVDIVVGIALLVPLGFAGGRTAEEPIAWWYWIFAALSATYSFSRSIGSNRRQEDASGYA
jgi:hypothetical protein